MGNSVGRAVAFLLATTMSTLVAGGSPAEAAFPGVNGKIVFASGLGGVGGDLQSTEIYVMNPDGSEDEAK